VDPTREASISLSWSTSGAAIEQREQEKTNAYQGQFNPAHYSFVPLVMELSGRMSYRMKAFIKDVAAFASRHLPDGGVGQKRFRSRFGYVWKSKLNVIFLKTLASSALHAHQAILERLPSSAHPVDFDLNADIF
jgi:hypothetical protein